MLARKLTRLGELGATVLRPRSDKQRVSTDALEYFRPKRDDVPEISEEDSLPAESESSQGAACVRNLSLEIKQEDQKQEHGAFDPTVPA